MIFTPSLQQYIGALNERALQLDIRNHEFIPPHGMVLTVQCDKKVVRIGVATGLGGIVEHVLPAGVTFNCYAVKKKKPRGLFDRITIRLFSKKK